MELKKQHDPKNFYRLNRNFEPASLDGERSSGKMPVVEAGEKPRV